eukprot:g22925.t1
MVSEAECRESKAQRLKAWLNTARCRLSEEAYKRFRATLPTLRQCEEAQPVLEKLAELLDGADFPEGEDARQAFHTGFAESLPPHLRPKWKLLQATTLAVPSTALNSAALNQVDLPRSSDFNVTVCRSTCDTLAESVAQGNHHHVEGLMVALRLMMPVQSGSERAFARPRDDFILRPEILQWSKQDFLGGLEENMRIVQSCEADWTSDPPTSTTD